MSVGCGGRNGEELIDIDAMIAFYLGNNISLPTLPSPLAIPKKFLSFLSSPLNVVYSFF
jgi:hypothetical protein